MYLHIILFLMRVASLKEANELIHWPMEDVALILKLILKLIILDSSLGIVTLLSSECLRMSLMKN